MNEVQLERLLKEIRLVGSFIVFSAWAFVCCLLYIGTKI